MKTSIRFLVSLLLAIVLAGCSRDSQPTTGSGASSDGPEAIEAPATQLKRALPHGIKFNFAYHLRQDRIRKVESGEPAAGQYQRRILIEYLDLDRQQVVDAITASLTAAGYEADKPRQLEDGRTFLGFKHENRRQITARVQEGGDLKHPSADGSVRIHIPTRSPAKTIDN